MNDKLRSIAYPAVTLVVILLAWHGATTILDVPDYLLPTPAAVWDALVLGYVAGGDLWPHLLFTLKSTLVGYVLGCSAAVVVGTLLAESRTFEQFVYPFIVAIQSMPKVALAPLIVVWLGFGLESKVVMVALLCFFPVLVNTIIGIRHTDPALIDMMRVFSGSRWRTFLKVKLPSAASHIFAGLQIAVVLALIGAVVAEFVASSWGLGYLVKAASVNMNTDTMFAALFSLSLIGVVLSNIMRTLHRMVIFWEKHGGQE